MRMPALTTHHLVCPIRFIDGQLPYVFVIPATAWAELNAVFVDRNYDDPAQTSKPNGAYQPF